MKLLRRTVMSLLVCGALTLAGAAVWFSHEGYRVYAVRTGSMVPTLRPGDAVLDAPAGRPLRTGQIVTFRSVGGGMAVTTHRIHHLDKSSIQTKGDANRTPDTARVHRPGVVGSVIATVPYGGYVLYFFSQAAGVASLVTALLGLVLLWTLFFPATRTVGASPAPLAAA